MNHVHLQTIILLINVLKDTNPLVVEPLLDAKAQLEMEIEDERSD